MKACATLFYVCVLFIDKKNRFFGFFRFFLDGFRFRFFSRTAPAYGISRTIRRRMETPCDFEPLTSLTSHDHTYCRKSKPTGEAFVDQDTERPDLEEKLKRKIKSLQQQLKRTKAKQQTMADIIHELQQKLILTPEDAENMHAQFDEIQLSIFKDTKNNVSCAPCGTKVFGCCKRICNNIKLLLSKGISVCEINSSIATSISYKKVVKYLRM